MLLTYVVGWLVGRSVGRSVVDIATNPCQYHFRYYFLSALSTPPAAVRSCSVQASKFESKYDIVIQHVSFSFSGKAVCNYTTSPALVHGLALSVLYSYQSKQPSVLGCWKSEIGDWCVCVCVCVGDTLHVRRK